MILNLYSVISYFPLTLPEKWRLNYYFFFLLFFFYFWAVPFCMGLQQWANSHEILINCYPPNAFPDATWAWTPQPQDSRAVALTTNTGAFYCRNIIQKLFRNASAPSFLTSLISVFLTPLGLIHTKQKTLFKNRQKVELCCEHNQDNS